MSEDEIYKPAYRSCGYAILVALLENMQENPQKDALSNDELVERAQKHCDEPFVNPNPETVNTAWFDVTRLVTKGFVLVTPRYESVKVEYSLTEQGVLIAKELSKKYADRPTTNDAERISGSLFNVKALQLSGSGEVIELPADSYDVILLINENATFGITKSKLNTYYRHLKHEYRNLKIGDYAWIARHKENVDKEIILPYIVERKRLDDLEASIQDGTLDKQQIRLRRCGLYKVIYMVENYGNNNRVPVQSVMQELANIIMQHGFKIHMSDSIIDSIRFLAMLTTRIATEYLDQNLKGYSKHPSNGELMTFQYFNTATYKPLTITETFVGLLLTLKGMTVERALGITYIYKTPASLIEAYKKCNQNEAEMLLSDIKYDGGKFIIGRSLSESIYLLFNQN